MRRSMHTLEQRKDYCKRKREEYKALILEHQHKIWIPELNGCTTNESCEFEFQDLPKEPKHGDDKVRTVKYTLEHTKEQKEILLHWFETTTNMYNTVVEEYQPIAQEYCNLLKEYKIKKHELKLEGQLVKEQKETLKNFKSNKSNRGQKSVIIKAFQEARNNLKLHKKEFIEFENIKIQETKNFKKIIKFENVRDRSDFLEHKKTLVEYSHPTKKIKTHIIDCAIRYACSSIKSAVTNFKRGNIDHFNVKKQGYKRNYRVMEVDKSYYNKGGLLYASLGELRFKYNKKTIYSSELEIHTCLIRYNKKEDKFNFHFFFPWKPKKDKESTNKIISIDPGIRTPLTCLSETQAFDKGKDLVLTLQKLINKRDIGQSKITSIRKKRRVRNRINLRIKNLVNEFHWKTCRELSLNYDNIIIGNMSSKSIIRKNGILTKMGKKVSQHLSFYTFTQRLKYKCEEQNKSMIIIDEFCTSKMCSRCGWENKTLDGAKVFVCQECNLIIDRDLNSCRGMFIKSFDPKNFRNYKPFKFK
jgi:transposase